MRSAFREDTQPWYKEPWPWLLMAGPAIVIVACIITIYLAFSRYDQPIVGGAVKQGLKVLPIEKTEQMNQVNKANTIDKAKINQ